MREFAEDFYKSTMWQSCRKSYLKSVGGLCENCLKKGIYKPAIIVHHKIHIEPYNIYNPEVTMSFNNLEALCRTCHGKAHTPNKRHTVDMETGEVVTYGDQS